MFRFGRAQALLSGFSLAFAFAGVSHADEPTTLTVHVEGERSATVASKDETGASYVLRGERLKAPGASSAAGASEVPGVQVAGSGASSDYATASVRGATSAETPVYLAGVRLNDDVTGTADLSLVPLWMIQRVEVYRTGAPFEADRLGPGGAVFFEPRLPRTTKVGAGIGIGSFGETSTFVAGMVGTPKAGTMLALRRDSAKNDYRYLDDRGTLYVTSDDIVRTRENADYEAYDAWSVSRFSIGRGQITAIVNALSREQGVPGVGAVQAKAARAMASRFLGAVTAQVPCASGDRCSLELSTASLFSESRLNNPLIGELALGTRFVSNVGDRLAETARLRYRPVDRVTLGLSAAEELEELRVDQPNKAMLRGQRGVSRASASANVDLLSWLSLNALGAIENHSTRATGTDATARTETLEGTGRAGLKVRLSEGMTLLVNGGRYARIPTLGELHGTSAVVQGNAALSPERGYVGDAGFRLCAGSDGLLLHADVFGFARFASDLIAYRRTSPGSIAPYNIGSARVLGLEAAAGATIARHVRTELTLTALDPRDVTPGRAIVNDLIPFRSRLVASPYVEVFTGAVSALSLSRASVGARLSYRSSYAYDPAGLVTGYEQAIADLELGASFLNDRISARFRVADLFDSPRLDYAGFPIPGRSFHGTLEAWW